MDLRLSHWDDPPPDLVSSAEVVHELCRQDRFRFANVLSVWAEVEDDRIAEFGHHEDSGLVMGATTVRVGGIGATFRRGPAAGAAAGAGAASTVRSGSCRRSAVAPAYRSRGECRTRRSCAGRRLGVDHVALTLRPDGTSDVELTGATRSPGTGCTTPSAGSHSRAA